MFKKFQKDSFLLGIAIGIIPVLLGYFSLIHYNEIMKGTGALQFKLFPPRFQLVILAITIVVFRFMIVTWNMVQTGKGLFLVVFLATLFYFFNERYKFL
jgi:hypothetical protein